MINTEAYEFTKEYQGVTEIKGPIDTRMIEVAHRLCKVEGVAGGPNTDELPWCSAWAVLSIICANIRRNPKRSIEMLQRRGFEMSLIKECFVYAKIDFNKEKDNDTLVPVVPPTWSANSKSWDKWGFAVTPKDAKRGDVVRLTRDGGGHVAFLDEDKMGSVLVTLLGGNQSDKVCSMRYPRVRLQNIRRMPEPTPVRSIIPPQIYPVIPKDKTVIESIVDLINKLFKKG